MRWIGQHIWDFISRFRSDVYLESIDSGTIASGGNLGLDSNNKIVKANTGDALSFDGSTANGILTYKDADEISVESSFTWDGSDASLTSSGNSKPKLYLKNVGDDNKCSVVSFEKNRASSHGTDDDFLGLVEFKGPNAIGTEQNWGFLRGQILTAANLESSAKMDLSIMASDGSGGTPRNVISGSGHGTDETVDVHLGFGASSFVHLSGDTVTSPGNLTLDTIGDISLDPHTAKDIYFKENGTERFQFHLDSTPTMEVTGNFDLDCSGSITLDSATGATTINSTMLDLNTDTINILSTTSEKPKITLDNRNADAEPPVFEFFKNITGDAGDYLGSIKFTGQNNQPETIAYASIHSRIAGGGHIDGDEAGSVQISIATSNDTTSNLRSGLNLSGTTTTDTVNASIGHGAASTTTVAGDLSVTSKLTFDSIDLTAIQTSGEAFADNDTSLMTSAAIDDRINAAGGGVSVSDSTANTNFPVVFHDESNNLHDDTGAFTYNPSTGTANIPIASIPKRKFATPSDGAGNADGDIIYIGTNTGGTATVAGKIYYYASTGLWVLTNSDDPSTATGLLAVALGTDPDADGMLLRGTVDLAGNIVGTEALGSIIYLDKATAGDATTAAPTSPGDIVRVIGYALTTGDANKIWFNPDNTWVEHV